jgi:hypothetical protein
MEAQERATVGESKAYASATTLHTRTCMLLLRQELKRSEAAQPEEHRLLDVSMSTAHGKTADHSTEDPECAYLTEPKVRQTTKDAHWTQIVASPYSHGVILTVEFRSPERAKVFRSEHMDFVLPSKLRPGAENYVEIGLENEVSQQSMDPWLLRFALI